MGLKILLVLTMLLCAALAHSTYYFLNNPENITQSGYYVKFDIKPDTINRFFFHYCNKSSHDLYFVAPVNMYDACIGYRVNFDPGLAGANAICDFNKDIPREIKEIKILVLRRQTISGICEGKSHNNFWLNYFDSCEYPGKSLKYSQSVIQHSLNKNVYVRFGDELMNKFRGTYGVTHRFILYNPDCVEHKYTIKISSRGGSIIFAYKVLNQNKLITLDAQKWYALEYIALKPRQIWSMEHIVTGGFYYPVELAVK